MSFIEPVAQAFSSKSDNAAPALEVTGSGNGFRLFCKGIGFEHPDINVTSRPITAKELRLCNKNGISAVTEITIGSDASVVVNSRESQPFDFTVAQLFTALAVSIERNGEIVKNSYSKWMDIDPSLPDDSIRVMGPPASSGAYDYFLRMVMERGCAKFPRITALNEKERYKVCNSMRTDQVFVQGPRSEIALLSWLQENPAAFGITRFSTLRQYDELIAGNAIDGVPPKTENISSGSYSLTRPVIVYVKTKHVAAVKGLQNFLYELTNDHTIGPDGYLATETDSGFVPLNDQARNHARDMALSLLPTNR